MQDILFIGAKSSGKSFIINSLRSGAPTHIEHQTLGVQTKSIPSKSSKRITYQVKKYF
jgi:GTPase SAR1 family protein